MDTKVKITKRIMFAAILEVLADAEARDFTLPEDIDYGMLSDFINHEVELLDNKAASSAKRAQDKREAGDQLREKIFNAMSDSEFMTILDIVKCMDDPEVTQQMVTARLTQLVDLNRVEKGTTNISSSANGGRSRKITTYRKIVN